MNIVIDHAVFAGRDDENENNAPVSLVVDDGVIVDIATNSSSFSDIAGDLRIDGRGTLLAPGFVELQTNGSYGHDFTADPETIPDVAARLPEQGVTSFLPTLVSPSPSLVERALAVLATISTTKHRGARPLGLHLEGPCLAPEKRGAHPAESILAIDAVDWSRMTRARGVRLVTLAPELRGASALVRQLRAREVAVSLGHTQANHDATREAIDAGAVMGTHIFNAMPSLHHREPGAAGALLGDDRAVVGLIADGIHVHPTLAAVVARAKGTDGYVLVTDAMAAAGCPDGRYELAGRDVVLERGAVRLPDGTLAGSALTMDEAIRNMIAWTGFDIDDILPAVTRNPARIIDEPRGRIAVGSPADFVWLDDHERIVRTMVEGRIEYETAPHAVVSAHGD